MQLERIAFDREGGGALASWMLLSGNEGALDPIVEAIHNMRKAGIDQVAIQPIIDNQRTVEIFSKQIMSRVK